MDSTNVDNGGSLALRGVLTTLFGIAAVFWPGITLTTLVYLFSAFVLVSGVIDMVVGVGHLLDRRRAILTRVMTLVLGLIEVGVGVYLVRHPAVTFATFILLIGFTLIIRGLAEIVMGLFEEGPSVNRIGLVLLGLLAGMAGIIVLFQPAASGVAFVWILGLYALVTGPLLIALGADANKTSRLRQA